MRMKKPRVATIEQVRITREGDESAVIEYLEPGISTTNFRIGPEIEDMTDHARAMKLSPRCSVYLTR
jgi:hypothetical protein